MKRLERLLSVLDASRGGASDVEIAARLGLTPQAVRRDLRDLADAGQEVRLPRPPRMPTMATSGTGESAELARTCECELLSTIRAPRVNVVPPLWFAD